MRKKRFTEEQIFKALKENESGIKTPEVCRKLGITEQTFYRWKSKYGGMELPDIRKMKSLQEENTQLKKLVADLSLQNQAIKAVLEKKW
ncbi:MAG: transposase [Leptospira sp.]|nr:transposase [Leptospira sp.]